MASCEVVALETLCAGQPGDAAEQLKRGLFALWTAYAVDGAANGAAADSGSFDSVLLVGDAQSMPFRYMMLDRATKAACDVAFYPCDLYYADLTDDADADGKRAFADWNHRTDGVHARYIGEVHGESGKDGPINADGCELVPEVAVGRWPVASAEEARAVAAKTLRHERAVAMRRVGGGAGGCGDAGAAARPTAEVVACGEWIDNRARVTAVADGLRRGFDVACLSYFDSDDARRPTPARISDALASGKSLVLHTGHGQPSGWHLGPQLADLARMRGLVCMPVLFSIGCSTAEIAPQGPYEPYRDADGADHKGTNAGEVFNAPPPPPACIQPRTCAHSSFGTTSVSMPEGGAVAYIGCTTGSQPCAHTLLDGFAAFVAEHPDAAIGAVWSHAVAQYVDAEHLRELKPTADWYPPSIYFQPMKFVLLGDPTARMK